MGLTPLFSRVSLLHSLQQSAFDEKNIIKALAFLGEQVINEARGFNTYVDDTGNLRSSIGYTIIKDGKVIRFKAPGRASEGKIVASDFAQDIAGNYQMGITLVIFAGMEYAAAVEAKGFDVLTGAVPTPSQVLNELRDALS